MGGTAIIILLQQLKGIFGLVHFTHKTDVVSVLHSILDNRAEVISLSFSLKKYINLRICYQWLIVLSWEGVTWCSGSGKVPWLVSAFLYFYNPLDT